MAEYFYWHYRLRLAGPGKLNARTPTSEIEGALLRHRDGGHACLQPWPTLGQGDLQASLRLLRDGGDSDLLARCRHCIALDGAARAAGKCLFAGKSVPPSHLTVPDWAGFAFLEEKVAAGFRLFKLKCGPDIEREAGRIHALLRHFGGAIRLRLDFNECLDPGTLRGFVEMLGNARRRIDFIEDPLRYEASVWRDLSAEIPIDLAVDRAAARAVDGFAVRVVKPAWEAVPVGGSERLVITSAMDHPLGQLFAASVAADLGGVVDECGLLTHWLFEPDAFSEALAVDGRRLVPPGGSGLGFDGLLNRLAWRAL